MTEAEWLKSASAAKLLGAVRERATPRQLRLFVCGCWRAYYQSRTSARSSRTRRDQHLAELLAAVEAGELLADGAGVPPEAAESWYATMADAMRAAEGTASDRYTVRHRIPARLIREVFGNPFRPVACAPAWLTSDVLALARGIYDERAFDRMPILADALQDAGCDSDVALAHCRDANAPHVRGC